MSNIASNNGDHNIAESQQRDNTDRQDNLEDNLGMDDNRNTPTPNNEGMDNNVRESEVIQMLMQPYSGDGEDEFRDERRALQRILLQFLQTGGNYGEVQAVNYLDHINHEDDNDHDNYVDDDEQGGFWSDAWTRMMPPSQSHDPDRFPKVPSEKGAELMDSGNFGYNEADAVSSIQLKNLERKKLALRIFNRELAIECPVRQKINQRLMAQGMIPSSNADIIIQFENPVYSGQFSDDGNFFFVANKDFRVRMYDTSNPYNWRYYKTVTYPSGRWTLTDASLSPDNKYLAYTSIQSNVCLAPTDPNDIGDPYILDLGRGPDASRTRIPHSFGIWSIRYSGDGRNLVAGATVGMIVVYDIESRTPIHQIKGHNEDVNAVCLADNTSPHILYSGSDDTTLKVWDTRSMGDNRAAGTFVGHIEGLTYIDSKGDGRYILSNGKDQSTKLWDVRMVMSPQQYDKIKSTQRTHRGYFDYRFGRYNENFWYRDPHDCSLVTYRGHRVLKTLIRCHFSPPGSTNSRYIYSGSQDGKVYIWNLDATLAGVIDVCKVTSDPLFLTPDDPEALIRRFEGESWSTCVRDASWHPNSPVIVASAWNGYGSRSGTCTLHTWNDGAEDDEAEPKMGIRLDERLNKGQSFYS